MIELKIIEKITAVMTAVALTGTLCAAALSDMPPYDAAPGTAESFSAPTHSLPNAAAQVKAATTSTLERVNNAAKLNTLSTNKL